MKKRLLALLLALCLLFAAAPVCVGAAQEQRVYASAATVTAGGTAVVSIKAESFSSIAVMDVYVYYDPQIFTVEHTSNGDMLNGAQTSVNTTEIGTVKLSAMSLDGISGDGTLFTIHLSTAGDCEPGTYPITVAVGRAHHDDLSEATIGSTNGSVMVNAPIVPAETFYIYGYSDKSTLKQGQTLTYHVVSELSARAFVSGDFTFTYDHKLFEFESVEIEAALTEEGAIYSVNSTILGQVRIAYASETPVSSYSLFAVTLRVIGDVDTTTTVNTLATNMYKEDLSPYLPDSCSTTLSLQKQPAVVDYPNAFLHTQELVVGKESQSTFLLEAGAGVAAADFIITYDPTVLSCIGVSADESISANGGMIIINDHFSEGTIRFSYIHMDAYDKTDLPLLNITWIPLQSPQSHYQVAINGLGVVDTKQNAVTLEYVTNSACIFVPTVFPPCVADGYTHYACPCGECYDGDYIPMMGHDEIYHNGKAPCFENGWDAYVTCSRCDYSTFEEIPAIGEHSYGQWIVETEAGRDSTGIKCRYCVYCDAREENVIPQILRFHTAGLTLESSVQVNFMVQKAVFDAYGYTDAYAVFEMYDRNGALKTVRVDTYRDNGTYYVFDFSDLAPDLMGNTITGTLYAENNGEAYVSKSVNYSVLKYCTNMLNNATIVSDDAYAEFRTLLVDLLNYGAAAQIYTNYKTDALVNADLTEEQKAWGSSTVVAFENDQAITDKVDNALVAWKGAGLVLEDAVTMTVDMQIADMTDLVVQVRCGSAVWECTTESFQAVAGYTDRYRLTIDVLGVQQMRQPVYFVAYKDGAAVSSKLSYSVETYAYKNASQETKLGQLLNAMMKYGDAAYAYIK